MRAFLAVVLLAVQLLAVYWWHDSELVGICAATAILLLLTGGRHARR